MRILKISIKNLNSIKGEYVIDFTSSPLSDSGLFAITGETGAGKSTILDAISLAMYQSIPRGSSEDDIMSYGTSEAYAEVEFSVKNRVYRSSWFRRRARKKVDGELQNSECRLADITNPDNPVFIAEKKTDIKTMIVEITGLDVDKFTQSVLLAQGQFAAFMKAKPKERGELLEKITQQKNYSIFSRGAYLKHKSELEKYDILKQSLQNATVLSQEEREELELNKTNLINEIHAQKLKLEKLSKEITWLKQIEEKRNERNLVFLELQKAKEAIDSFAENRDKLEWHKKTIPLQREILLWEEVTKNIKELSEKLDFYKLNIPILKENQALAQAKLDENMELLNAVKQSFASLVPDIEKANNLDELIRQQGVLNGQYLEQRSDLLRKIKVLEKDFSNGEKLLKDYYQQLKIINLWIEKSKHYENLPELKGNLLVQLPDLERLNALLISKRKLLENSRSLLPKYQNEIKKLIAEEDIASIERNDVVGKNEQKSHELSQLLSGKSLSDLREESSLANDKLLIISNLCSLSDKHKEMKQHWIEYHQQLDEKKVVLETLSVQKLEIENKIQTQEKLVESLEANRELELLVKNYELDREKLQDGNPCFLCGSTNHPFVEKKYVSKFSDIEKQLKLEKQNLQKTRMELSSVIGNMPKESDFQDLNNSIEKCKISMDGLIKSFDSEISKVGASELVIDDFGKLFLYKEKYQKNAQLLNENVKRVDVLHDEISKMNNSSTVLLEKLNTIHLKKNGLEMELGNLSKNVQEAEVEIVDIQRDLDEKKDLIVKLILPYNIILSDDVLEKVSQMISEFEFNTQKRGEILSVISQNEVLVESLKKQIEGIKQDSLVNVEKEILKLEEKIVDFTKQRALLLDGRNVKDFVNDFNKKIAEHQQIFEKSKQDFEDVQNVLKLHLSKEEDALLSHSQKLGEKVALVKNLEVKMSGIFESLEDVFAKRLESDEYERLIKISDDLHNQFSSCKIRHETICNQLEKLQTLSLTEESMESLFEQSDLISSSIDGVNESLTHLNLQLLHDAEVRKSQFEILQKIEAQQRELIRWERLRDLIGSADGDKFRKFAQSITMRVLAEKANQHLERISGRYQVFLTDDMKRLQELNFDIIDTYQGDNVRPMNTLSGGETFLVSLALALGLSDMASGLNPVESLFVDEGFGTLDPQTLEMALSALENLQSTGKTIGVISHVELLKERIPCQIRLIKKGAGISEIVVKS